MNTAALLLVGLVALLGQVVLLREIGVAFFGVELIYLIALGLWLLLTALGALAGRARSAPPEGRLATLLILFAWLLPLGAAFLRASRILLGGVPGAFLPLPLQFAVLAGALAPAALLSGLLFRAAALTGAERGRTLAGAYGIESLGGLAGGALASAALHAGMQTWALTLLTALLAAAGALLFGRVRRQRVRPWAALATALLLALLLWQAAPLDRLMTRWNHPDLLAGADTPHGRATLERRSGQLALFVNDALVFESEGTAAERFAHLAALQHPQPRRILLVGGGLEGIPGELLRHRPERIDWLEVDRRMLRLVRGHLPAADRAALDHPAVRLLLAEPRQFLRQRGAAYDLILVGMPEPASGQANRFYTREFFADCAARLAPGGVVALRLAASETFWTPQLLGRLASVRAALAAVFAEQLVLPGETAVLTASDAPLPGTAAQPAARLRERGIVARLVTPAYLDDLWRNERRADLAEKLAAAGTAANSDRRPVCYAYAATAWLGHFLPRLALADLPLFGAARPAVGSLLGLGGLGAALLFLLARLWPAARRWLLVATAGFLGMAFESVLLLAYQTRAGVLYRDLGFLMTAFMAGLALGAWALLEAGRGRGSRQAGDRRQGAALLGGFGLAVLAAIGALHGWLPVNLPIAATLLAVTGFAVAGLLAYASLHGVKEQRRVMAPLYAADLAGGALGALAASLAMIPLLGLDGTLLAQLGLAVLALLLI